MYSVAHVSAALLLLMRTTGIDLLSLSKLLQRNSGVNEGSTIFASVLEEKELLLQHDKRKEAALLHYTRFSAGDSAEEYKEKLLLQITETLNSTVAKNVSLSRIACKALLAKLRTGIDERLSAPMRELLPEFEKLVHSAGDGSDADADADTDGTDAGGNGDGGGTGDADSDRDADGEGDIKDREKKAFDVTTSEGSTLLLAQFTQLEQVHKREVGLMNEALVTYEKLARGPEKTRVLATWIQSLGLDMARAHERRRQSCLDAAFGAMVDARMQIETELKVVKSSQEVFSAQLKHAQQQAAELTGKNARHKAEHETQEIKLVDAAAELGKERARAQSLADRLKAKDAGDKSDLDQLKVEREQFKAQVEDISAELEQVKAELRESELHPKGGGCCILQ